MLRNASELKHFTIRATDGEIGTVEDIYFDDETWAIRYLTVETDPRSSPPNRPRCSACDKDQSW